MTKRFFLACSILIAGIFAACTHKPYVNPNPTGDASLCFERDILPIFVSECAKSGCHDAQRHEEGYMLDSYEHIVRKGIVVGNAAASKIYQSITGTAEEKMPRDAAALSSDKIALIKEWIDAGAVKDSNCAGICDSNNFAYNSGVKPLVEKYCTGCHSGSAPQGSVTLTSYNAVKDAVLNKSLIQCINYTPGYNGMPQGLHLSNCEVRQIEKWVDAGMPNN
ncbi:MAG: hypothetical protein JST70_11380 [Bacteroidetes bacterium]|nr:hypothetical protein [Bacteroidota bacterium]